VDDYIRSASEPGREEYLAGRGRMEPEPPAPPAGVEWGVASLVLGAVFALMVPPCLVLIAVLGRSGNPGNVAMAAGFFFVLVILLLSAAGVGFGVLSMSAAQRVRRPIALGLAGVMLNALNLLMWAGALLAWYSNW
jgi:hypothetical protein